MKYLIDTGVLLRLFDASDTHHSTIKAALRSLRSANHGLVVFPQNVAEFWNVSTRPTSARGGYGCDADIVDRRVNFVERFGRVVSENNSTYAFWRRLVVDHQVKGVAVHDARLVAGMLAANINKIVTLNGSDFTRYSQIEALSPDDVLKAL